MRKTNQNEGEKEMDKAAIKYQDKKEMAILIQTHIDKYGYANSVVTNAWRVVRTKIFQGGIDRMINMCHVTSWIAD